LHTASPSAKNGSEGSLRPTPRLRNTSILDITTNCKVKIVCVIFSQAHKMAENSYTFIIIASHHCYQLKHKSLSSETGLQYMHSNPNHTSLQFLMFHNGSAQGFNVRLFFISYDSTFEVTDLLLSRLETYHTIISCDIMPCVHSCFTKY
jgi:hypothetical protein